MEAAEPTPEFDLSLVRVRLIESDERARWDALMRAHHYLEMTAMVGRSLRYVAHLDGHWLALLGRGPRQRSKWQAATPGSAGRPRCNGSDWP